MNFNFHKQKNIPNGGNQYGTPQKKDRIREYFRWLAERFPKIMRFLFGIVGLMILIGIIYVFSALVNIYGEVFVALFSFGAVAGIFAYIIGGPIKDWLLKL